VRFYEAEGLIRSELREDGTHRKFAASELQKLQIIADLRESGLSLQEIKDLMALKRGQGGAEDAACAMSSALCAQVQDLDRRVATLNRVRGELASMINMLEECRVCTSPTFPAACATCDRAKQPDAERATQLFWKH
jgi:DNA-binding transcriptional MerR regulator